MSWSLRKYGFCVFFIGLLCILLTMYTLPLTKLQGILSPDETPTTEYKPILFNEGFLVDTKKCKIPNVDPWSAEVKHLYSKKDHVRCSDKRKLTRITYTADGVFLEIDEEVKLEYSKSPISCCYSNVTRGKGETPDLGISVSNCRFFKIKVQLTEISVLVKCKTATDGEIYSNTHSLLPKTLDVERKLKLFKKSQPPSILLIGIDSLSRLNFHRVFSKTKRYLHGNDWLEYKGYNKIGDNTLPNLMALLTGKNLTSVLKVCDPRDRVENCNFIWKDYNKLGYITAYAEDETSINTFTTYSYKGFREKPADFYYMPYLTASEKQLHIKKFNGMTYCAGVETSAERVLNIAKEMVVQYPEHPKLGFFWMNSFSHDDINAPGRVDEIFAEFFSEVQPFINNNTIVMFFSDHGIRFGDIRVTRSGWLEERLPFLYFWIPNEFRDSFPREVANLVKNSHKLTTPYDIYMTLQHILVLNGLNYVSKPSEACPNCKSLLTDIEDRSCEEASIQFHWCTCFGYSYLDPTSEIVLAASEFAIAEINALLDSDPQTYYNCMRFTFKSVMSAGISENTSYNKTFLLLIFETVPYARFEVTLSVHRDGDVRYFINEGSTSRLDRYDISSTCVTDHMMYCYCRSNFLWHLNFFSFWFEI